jgi:hypothetical protein
MAHDVHAKMLSDAVGASAILQKAINFYEFALEIEHQVRTLPWLQ